MGQETSGDKTRPTPIDWEPSGPDVRRDQRAAYDAMRERCPVARDGSGAWTVFSHAGVERVVRDHQTFSNVVSQHVSVPNGMDPPEHTIYRRLIEPYFSDERVAAFEPECRRIAAALVEAVCADGHVDLMETLALPFASHAQCAYLGWSSDLADALVRWTLRSQKATLEGDRTTLAAIADELQQIVLSLRAERQTGGADTPADLTDVLLRETIDGEPLDTAALTSILRNWTMGEVGTIAAAVGILAGFLAREPLAQHQLRRHHDWDRTLSKRHSGYTAHCCPIGASRPAARSSTGAPSKLAIDSR